MLIRRSSIVTVEPLGPCTALYWLTASALGSPTLPIGNPFALRAFDKLGDKSNSTAPPVAEIVTFVGSVVSMVIPLPSASSLARIFSPVSSEVSTVFDPYVVGVSLRSLNLICPPAPNIAYNSLKLAFTLRNDSRILSPVPSLPCTPISIVCFVILYSEAGTATACCSCVGIVNCERRTHYFFFIVYF